MLRKTRPWAALVAVLVLGACSALPAAPIWPHLRHAAAPDVRSDASLGLPADAKLTGYLRVGDINGAALLGPPPATDSLRGRADRETYLATRTLAGSPRWTEAKRDDDIWNGGALGR